MNSTGSHFYLKPGMVLVLAEKHQESRAAAELPSLRASVTPRKRAHSTAMAFSDNGDLHAAGDGTPGGLRTRASAGQHSADSGELGPTQARAAKSASHAREGLVSSGHARLRCSRLNQVLPLQGLVWLA